MRHGLSLATRMRFNLSRHNLSSVMESIITITMRNSFWLGNIVGTSFPSSGAYCIQQLRNGSPLRQGGILITSTAAKSLLLPQTAYCH